jgi:cytochrome c oxidase subunit 4/cytochrome o ubiquinol oxidase operon protein cyoD
MAETHDSHGDTPRFYLTIGVILAVVTIVEVVVAWPGLLYNPENPNTGAQLILVPALLLLSIFKGALVVLFFMHLRGDARVFKLLFIAPFLLAVSMLSIFLVLFWSGHVGIAG